ncbi:MAG: alpha/beta fold hydrolase [Acidimicrobiia bacterium]|nr:alpha/beta fold hydrolase [Acidimicrobiia bacterium]
MLHVRRFGAGEQLLALHGFSLTGSQFEDLASSLDWSLIAPDLPGHGGSASQDADVDSVVGSIVDLAEVLEHPLPSMGYSQGGRMALLAALARPDLFNALVLVSANAGIEIEQDRRNRLTQDDARAARIELLGLDRFLDEWTTTGITATSHRSDQDRQRDRALRAENTSAGLAAALRGYGQGSQPVVWSRLGEISMPVLVLAGEKDAVYTGIAERLADAMPAAEMVIVPGTGHNPLQDDPVVTAEAIESFLDRVI